jgi:N6-L-threonylcarbamoyladenine synthase
LGRSYDFSFSGLKTAVLRLAEEREEALQQSRNGLTCTTEGTKKSGPDLTQISVADLAASFQEAVVDVLVEKTKRAATTHKAKQVLIAGGVAANKMLREEMSRRLDVPVRYPPIILCTDNAAMIAAAGYFRLQTGHRAGLDLDVIPNLPFAG